MTINRDPSLRRRLLILLLSLIALVWGVAGYRIWQDARDEVEEVLDANLAHTASLLLTLTQHDLEEAHKDREEGKRFRELEEITQKLHRYEHQIAFQIFNARGRLLLHSPNAPNEVLGKEPNRFENLVIDGSEWRTYALYAAFGQIHVGMPLNIRDELVDYIIRNTLWPVPIGLLLTAVLVWWAVGSGLRPLVRIAAEVSGRNADDLRQLKTNQAPREIRPLVNALNGLFARLERAFDNERRFTADASHELRTPLAAIRIQAQVARRAETPDQRDRALAQIVNGVDRATHLVEQLLTLARADAQQADHIRQQRTDLAAVVQSALEQTAGFAIERRIDLEFLRLTNGPWEICGEAEYLGILLRNLVDNALRYTPEAGQVSVSLERSSRGIILTVTDSGPGIPEEDRQKMFERFHRRNHQATLGSGLGLSIVERIAELHGAALQLGDNPDGSGLRVTVQFAAAATH